MAAAIFSFARHDPNPEYEATFFRRLKAQEEKDDLEVTYQAMCRAVIEVADGRMSVFERWSDRIASEVKLLNDEQARLERRATEDLGLIDNVLKKRILAYRQGNRDHRTVPEPSYFSSL
jgi:hypothetical protein